MGRPPASGTHPPDEAGETAYEPPESLSGPVATSIKWVATSRVFREATRLATAVLLARLLTPAEWGVAGMALLVVAILTRLSDLALPAALVQRARISEADRSTIFWTSLALGVLVTTVAVAISGAVADFFGEAEVQSLMIVAALSFLIASVEKVPGALLTRDLAFRALELRQMAATLAGAVAAVALALAGTGPWAIIGNSVATALTSAVLLWMLTSWRPRAMFSWVSFRSLTGCGAAIFGSQLLAYVQHNIDKLLVGRYIGAAGLGSYSFAYNLMFTPVLNIAYPLQGVLFPAYAIIQEQHDRLNTAFLRAKRLAVATMAPLFLLMFVLAPDLLPTVFGPRWDDAIPVLQLLSLAGVAYSLATQDWLLLLVRNKTRTLLGLTAIVTATITVAAAIGLAWGIVGVAAAYAIAQWVVVVPETAVVSRSAAVPFRSMFGAMLSPLPFVGAATAAAYGVRSALVELDVPAWARMAIVSVVLVGLYVVLAYVGSRVLRREIRSAVAYARTRLPRRSAPVAPV
jgi:polysaccharide transporter, PST family